MSTAARLRIFRFPSLGDLSGEIVGAIERLEPAADTRLLDALLVARDPDSGELQAIDLATGHADGTPVTLLDFRLDAGARAAITRRTLSAHRGGVPRAVVERMGHALQPGAATLALLTTDELPPVLADAVADRGARVIGEADVTAARLGDVPPALLCPNA